MSATELPDVTLALVDANVLSCWESKVKLGFECSLLLKHSKGKITTTLQFSTVTKSPSVPQAEKVKKTKNGQTKKTRGSKKKLEALLSYQQRLVKEKGLPPSRLMLQHAAVETPSTGPVPEPGHVSGEEFKCEQCDFSSKSKRGLKTHISRIHKDIQKPEVHHEDVEEPENLCGAELEKSLNISQLSQNRDLSLVNSTLSSTPVKENVIDSVIDESEDGKEGGEDLSSSGEKSPHKCPPFVPCRRLKCQIRIEKEREKELLKEICRSCDGKLCKYMCRAEETNICEDCCEGC